MTEPCVRAVAGYGGFYGEFRKLDRSGWHRVQVNGVEQLYDTEFEAYRQAHEARERNLFGLGILRHGEKASLSPANAAEIERIWPGKGRKAVLVERR